MRAVLRRLTLRQNLLQDVSSISELACSPGATNLLRYALMHVTLLQGGRGSWDWPFAHVW